MKRFSIISFALLVTLLCGCIHEDLPVSDGEEGADTWVTIPFACSSFGQIDIGTRSNTGIIAESRVKNIFLFIFKSDGTRLYGHFFDGSNLGTQTDIMAGRSDGWWVTNTTDKSDPYGAYTSASPDSTKWTRGGIRIKAPTYTGGHLYAIANIDGDMINISPESLNLIRTESDLQALTAHLQPHNQTLQRNGYFPMTGEKNPIKIVGSSNKMQCSDGGSGWKSNWYLELERMDAKIQFRIQVDIGHSSYPGSGSDAEYKELMSFKPESWQVVNVPKGCTVFKTPTAASYASAGTDTAQADAEGYFDSLPVPTETATGEDDDPPHPVYGFTFYMMENRESANKNGSASGYHQRDLRKKDGAGRYLQESGDMWQYAPEWATYVIIKGVLNMEVVVTSEAKDQTLCADVTYVIHLGDFTSSADNYDILRNTYYTYTVNIQGVDKIVLEVTSSQPSSLTPFTEDNSGAFGGVNIAKESTFTFDCHYGQRVFCFDADHIDPDHCFWYVKTPYGKEGIPPRVGDADVPSGFDYKWVHFMVNPTETTDNQYGVKQYKHHNQPYPGDDSPQLMDVVQLTAYLRDQKRKYSAGLANDFRYEFDPEWYAWATRTPDLAHGISGGGLSSPGDDALIEAYAKRPRIYITAYVDEFYYQEHPINPERTTPDFWKTFVNQPNRMMFLLCDSYFSLDKASSATGSVITIRQRAIQTPYNITRSAAELPDAWGTEVVDETEGLVWFYSQGEHAYSRNSNHTNFHNEIPNYVSLPVNSKFNGRYNSASNWQFISNGSWVGGGNWSDRLNFEAENDENYVFLRDDPADDSDATMRWACLMRNRDNDGDGTIDPEEIRWYMASSEQIIDLYLGGQGLSDEAMSYSQAWADRTGVYPAGDKFAGVDRWRLHYITSTINKNTTVNKNLPDMIRAEEGPNIGEGYYHMDVYWDNSHKQGRFTTRCVRNLGMDAEQLNPATAAAKIADVNSLPTSMVIATPSSATINASTTYTFDCANINEKSLRYYSSIELEPESEFGQAARLWKKFQTGPWVSITDVYGSSAQGQNYKNIYNSLLAGKSPCPEGYRVPNIREAAVMLLFASKTWWNASGSCIDTNVSNWIYCGPSTGTYAVGGNGKDQASAGNEQKKNSWVVIGNTGRITLGSTSNNIRCVRDLPE